MRTDRPSVAGRTGALPAGALLLALLSGCATVGGTYATEGPDGALSGGDDGGATSGRDAAAPGDDAASQPGDLGPGGGGADSGEPGGGADQGGQPGTDGGCADCICLDGATRACGGNVGECRPGTENCAHGRWTGHCLGETGPGAEGCDGLDNDCDGQTDEGCACQDGATRACGSDVGECRPGSENCADGRWTGTCLGETGPGFEGCDGLDNDCDGQTDEGCECQPGMTRACGVDEGDCRRGQQRCVRGAWDECDGAGPGEEVCDGRDNDCDGAVDEGDLCGDDAVCERGDCRQVRWVYEAEGGGMGHDIGRRDGDGWSAATGSDPRNGVMLYGPYDDSIPPGNWVAYFRMMIDNNNAGNDDVVRLEVNDFDGDGPNCGDCRIAARDVGRREFQSPNRYQDIPLPFVNDFAGHRLEFRVVWYGTAYINVDRVTVQ